jgi:glutamine amidotransferase
MFGLASARPVSARELVHDAPRSLRTLSLEHHDGWGIALRDGDDWRVHRSTTCAARCEQFAVAAQHLEATLVIAHVRKRTVGALALANTHPFRRDRFVFAHNGTVRDIAALVARCSPDRLAQVEGETDSERLFAFVLTHVDLAGDIERGVRAAVRALHALGDVGSANFLLSCGARLYAHRLGRSLFTLARDGITMVASERLTDEPWHEVAERELVLIDATSVAALAA